MSNVERRLVAKARAQHGSFTREQSRAAGLSDRERRRQVRAGFLDHIGVRTFRSPLSPETAMADLVALMLDVGEPVWASGPTAAALHGFDGFPLAPPWHLTTLRDRQVRRVGHIVHTTSVLPAIDRCVVRHVAATAPARTIIDLARGQPRPRLASAIDSAIRDGRMNEDLLHRRIVALRSQGRFGVPALLDVLEGNEVTRGGHSWLERRYLRLLADAGLPQPLTQQLLARAQNRLVRVDCRFPGTNVVVELLGYRYHRSRSQGSRDAARMNALIRDGYEPYQFTYDQVVGEERYVVDTTRIALHGSTPAG